MSGIGAFTTVAVGTGINAAHTVAKGKDPFPVLMAGTVLGAVCVAVNDMTNSNIGTAFGALFLLGSFLVNGVALIDMTTKVVNSGKA